MLLPRAGNVAAAAAAADTRHRLIISTDIGGDPNDRQELIYFLTHVNEFRVRGLIASAAGTPDELGPVNTVAAQPALINGYVNNYGTDRANLTVHAPPASDWPTSAELLALVKTGSTLRQSQHLSASATPTGRGDAWAHIIAMVDESAELLWISIWGGAFDTAQAILSASISKSSSAFAAFKSKLRIHTITDQDTQDDNTLGTISWIRANHPDIWMIQNGPFRIDRFDRQFRGGYQNDHASGVPLVPSALFPMVHTPWVQTNVHGHGALGDAMPTNVGQFPLTTNNHSSGLKFADGAGWMAIMPNGLGDPNDPSAGSWGGRFIKMAEPNYYEDAQDLDTFNGSTVTGIRIKWCFARWREQIQNDLAARMDWCDTGVFANANHYPIAVLNGDTTKNFMHIAADGGATVNLSAAGSTDPDGNTLSYKWWHYKSVGNSYSGTISITGPTSQACSFPAPNTSTTIHIILEVRDNGTPPLTSYRRAIVTITAVGAPPAPLDATFWLRAEDAAAFTLSGSNVTAAANQGSAGGALNLTQGTAGSQPLRVAGVVNGKAVLRFDGGDFLRSAVVSGSAFLTADQNVVFLVQKQTGTKARNTSFTWRAAATTNRFTGHLSYDDVLYWDSGDTVASSGRVSVAQPMGWDDAWHIVELVRDGVTARIIVDGVERVSDATMLVGVSLATSQAFSLGAQYNGTDFFLGDLAEIIIARGSGAVDSAARLAVRQALATYYGIGLPGGGDQAPVVAIPLVDQNATVGSAFSYQFAAGSFTDPESVALTYTATLSSGAALPAWLTFTAGTRTFSGTPATGDIGTITVRVTATDPGALSVFDDFTIAVAAAGGATAGQLKITAEEPIASGLVFFAGSAPTGSSLIMRDQVASTAAVLAGGAPATLSRAHPTKAGWVGADFALSDSAIYWALSTQVKTITTAHTVFMHVTLDSVEAWCSLLNIPRSDTAYNDTNDGPIRWRRSSTTTSAFRNIISTTTTGKKEALVDPGITLWSGLGTRVLTYRRSGAASSARVGGTQAAVSSALTAALVWPTTSHIIVSAPHRTRLTIDGRWDGGLFQLAIWNRSLSDSEIAALEADPLLLQHQ
jgi:hypothetical protein